MKIPTMDFYNYDHYAPADYKMLTTEAFDLAYSGFVPKPKVQQGRTYKVTTEVRVSSVRNGTAYSGLSQFKIDDFTWELTTPQEWADKRAGDIWESNGIDYVLFSTDRGWELRPTDSDYNMITEAHFDEFLKTNPSLTRRK
jgi:hypothetical protein